MGTISVVLLLVIFVGSDQQAATEIAIKVTLQSRLVSCHG